jgi:hypothetical protein
MTAPKRTLMHASETTLMESPKTDPMHGPRLLRNVKVRGPSRALQGLMTTCNPGDPMHAFGNPLVRTSETNPH